MGSETAEKGANSNRRVKTENDEKEDSIEVRERGGVGVQTEARRR
jgi:hypothetical protein